MFQKVILLGRISEPKVASSNAGNTIVSFGLATQSSKDSPTEWFNCSLIGKFADAMNGKLTKGQLVFVEARASSNKGNDGKTYTTYFVDTLRICSGVSGVNEAGANTAQAAQPQNGTFNDDVPF